MKDEDIMTNRSVAGPVIMMLIGFSLVIFSIIGILGVDFWRLFDDFFNNFGNFMSAWGESFGEFMGAWGENFGAFLSSVFTSSGLRILGGAAMLIVGLIVIVVSLKAFRR